MRLGVLDLHHPQWAIALAPLVESLGYSRYWLAEHHGDPAQSGSPEVLTAIVAALTTRLRVGPAGVLLRYYSPYKVAQNVRLLEDAYPGRIDIGVARGAGGDEAVAGLLLDGRDGSQDAYETKLGQLAALVRRGAAPAAAAPAAAVPAAAAPVTNDDARARPTLMHTTAPPAELWVLGASRRTALLAARLGANFGYSEYFARMVDPAADGAAILRAYRDAFVAATPGARPHCNVAIAGVACASQDEPPMLPLAGPPSLVGDVRTWRRRLHAVRDHYETDDVVVLDLCMRFADHRTSHTLLAEAADLTAAR